MKPLLFLIVILIGFAGPLRAGEPCCGVISVDLRTGTVTARENATGRTFEFQVTNAKLLASLHAGSPVYANFSAKQVSLDGRAACCSITKITLAPPRAGAAANVAPPVAAGQIQNKVKPIEPCCGVTAIDNTTGVVTAKENASGKLFQFKVTDAALLRTLQAGQGIYANFGARQVSVDGGAPCCNILDVAAAPMAAGQTQNKVKPLEPCCGVTAIDSATGVVTAKENASGKLFQFKVTEAALLRTLQAGQGIYANFGARQVSLDGAAPCCSILGVTAAPSTGVAPGPPPPPPSSSSVPSGAGTGSKPGQQKPTTQQTPTGSNTDKPITNTSQINAAEPNSTASAIRGVTAATPPTSTADPNATSPLPSATVAANSLISAGQPGLQIPDIAGGQQPLQFAFSNRPSPIHATFTNQGTDTSADPQPQWYVDGQAGNAQPSIASRISTGQSWPRGEQRTYNAQVSLTPGLHEIRAVIPVQPGETVADNNTAIFPAFAGMPDLVAEFDEKFIDEHSYRRFRFWTTNKGDAPSTPCSIRMVAYSRAGAQSPDPALQSPWNQDGTVTADIPSVAPAQKSEYLYAQLRYATVYSTSNPTGVDPGPRQYKFEFFVDEANAVPEANKQNNTLIYAETLAGAHDTKVGKNHW